MTHYRDLATILLRLALAANFISPVVDRFGGWGAPGEPGVAWGTWQAFVDYTAQVNSFLPSEMSSVLAVIATALEIILAIMLLIGFRTRKAAAGSALLTFVFAIAMTVSFGIKVPLDYAVFVDFTAAFLLATIDRYPWSVDEILNNN